MIIYCKDCGHILKATDTACPNCGSNDRNILSEDWGHGKDSAKVIIAELEKKIQAEPNLDTTTSQTFYEEQREFYKKLIAFLETL